MWLHWPDSMYEQGVPEKNALLSVKLPCEKVFPRFQLLEVCWNTLMRKLPQLIITVISAGTEFPHFSLSRSATVPLSTAASSNTRVSRFVRPITTSPAAVCVRPAKSPSWAAVSLPWGPNSTHTTLCVTSVWSLWAKVALRSKRTSHTATPASSNYSVEDTAGLYQPLSSSSFGSPNEEAVWLWVLNLWFFYSGNEGGAGLFLGFKNFRRWGTIRESSNLIHFTKKKKKEKKDCT